MNKISLRLLILTIMVGAVFAFYSENKVNASLDCQTYWQCMSNCSQHFEICSNMCGNQGCTTPSMEFCDKARMDASICYGTYGPSFPPGSPPNPGADPIALAECLAVSKIDYCQ